MDGRGSDRAAVLQVEELGETQITEDVFQDYLRTQGGDRFRGDRYDLFRHNCNNFSHETAQFLVGRGIPQHIVDLPGEILATPMGQMLAPMLQQMAPSGTSIPFTNNPAAPGPAPGAPPPPSSAPSSQPAAVSGAKLPVKEFITFDQPLKIDGLSKKLEEFNTKQPDEMKLSDSEVKIVIGIAKGLVRLSDENFAILTKVAKWKKDETFPLLDILRFKCVRSIFDNAKQVEQVAKILQDHLGPDTSPVSGMLAVRALANLLQKPEWRHLAAGGDTVTAVLGRVPTEHANTEIAVATFLYNMSVVQLQERNLDTCILIASSLVLQVKQNLFRMIIVAKKMNTGAASAEPGRGAVPEPSEPRQHRVQRPGGGHAVPPLPRRAGACARIHGRRQGAAREGVRGADTALAWTIGHRQLGGGAGLGLG